MRGLTYGRTKSFVMYGRTNRWTSPKQYALPTPLTLGSIMNRTERGDDSHHEEYAFFPSDTFKGDNFCGFAPRLIWKGIYSKRKEVAPKKSQFFPFIADPFSEGIAGGGGGGAILAKSPPLNVYSFTIMRTSNALLSMIKVRPNDKIRETIIPRHYRVMVRYVCQNW